MDGISGSSGKRKRHSGEQPARKKAKKDHRSRHWIITFNNPADDTIDLLLAISSLQAYCIQEETGTETGTPHLQGALSFKHAKKWSELNNITDGNCYWAPARNIFAVRVYCSKMETRSGKSWKKGYKIGKIKVKDPLEGKTLYNWQKKVLDIIEGPIDDRQIHWIWSDKGGIGKSALVKHLVMSYGAIISGGNMRDAYYGISETVKKGEEVSLVLFDIPRSSRGDVTYAGIEGIKNGLFFSTKYESAMCIFNTPHIIVMANESPDYNKMSRDRWVVTCLDNEEDLAHIASQN